MKKNKIYLFVFKRNSRRFSFLLSAVIHGLFLLGLFLYKKTIPLNKENIIHVEFSEEKIPIPELIYEKKEETIAVDNKKIDEKPPKEIKELKTIEKKEVKEIVKEKIIKNSEKKISDMKKNNKNLINDDNKKKQYINNSQKELTVLERAIEKDDQKEENKFERNSFGEKIAKNQNISGLSYKIIKEINPNYPIQAKKIGIKETVIIKVKFLVGLNGQIEKIEFIDSINKFGFKESVEKALEQWKFEPINYKGENIKIYFYKDFTFKVEL